MCNTFAEQLTKQVMISRKRNSGEPTNSPVMKKQKIFNKNTLDTNSPTRLELRQDIFTENTFPANTKNIQEMCETDNVKEESKSVKLLKHALKEAKVRSCRSEVSPPSTPTHVAEEIMALPLDSANDVSEGWFDARKILLQMSKNHATSIKELANNNHVECKDDEQIEKKFSDSMKDAVQTVCQICRSVETFVNMRGHTRKAHGVSITDYKSQHGLLIDHMVEAVYHRCGVCSKAILLNGDNIAPHAKSHSMTHKEYTAKYMTLKKAGRI
jgi:hypothetical protein